MLHYLQNVFHALDFTSLGSAALLAAMGRAPKQ